MSVNINNNKIKLNIYWQTFCMMFVQLPDILKIEKLIIIVPFYYGIKPSPGTEYIGRNLALIITWVINIKEIDMASAQVCECETTQQHILCNFYQF